MCFQALVNDFIREWIYDNSVLYNHRLFLFTEIKGAINLIENMFGNHYDLLFMACGSMFADSPIFRSDLISPSGGDIIVLNGLSGKQIWRKHFNNMPIEADCSLIYNKNNSNNECIMVGHGNYIALISSNEGDFF